MRYVTRTFAILTAALGIASAAAAATAPSSSPWATPIQASGALIKGHITGSFYAVKPADPLAAVAWRLQTVITSANCAGIGAPHKGAYLAFSCTFTWHSPNEDVPRSYRQHVWVRLWPPALNYVPVPAVCASSRTIADCPPQLVGTPLPGDPRTAGAQSAGAMSAQAEELTLVKLHTMGHDAVANLSCGGVTAFVYHCAWIGGESVVAWTRARTAWSTSVSIVDP